MLCTDFFKVHFTHHHGMFHTLSWFTSHIIVVQFTQSGLRFADFTSVVEVKTEEGVDLSIHVSNIYVVLIFCQSCRNTVERWVFTQLHVAISIVQVLATTKISFSLNFLICDH